MKIDLVGGAYKQNYSNLNAQQCINWYPYYGTDKEGNKENSVLLPTPGLDLKINISGNYPVRGLATAKTVDYECCYAVISNVVYKINSDYSTTTIGTMSNVPSNGTGRVYMECNNNNQVMILDSLKGYILNLVGDTLSAITDADFPTNGTHLAYLDGYFLLVSNGYLYYSSLNDGTSWVATDKFTPTFRSDPVKAIAVFKEILYIFGSESIELYVNDGSTPFTRLNQNAISYGVLAPNSVATFHDGIVFLGQARGGFPGVYAIGGDATITIISPPSITKEIGSANTLEDCEGKIEYTEDGQIWYYLDVPSLNKTYVWDALTKEWHQRQSKAPYSDVDGSPIYGMYRGRVLTSFKGRRLVGDRYYGYIFQSNPDTKTENTELIRRVRTSRVYSNENNWLDVRSLEIDTNVGDALATGQGSNPILMFETSQDGGRTWGQPNSIFLGALGKYDNRAKINRLGSGRNWAISVTLTDPVDVAIFGCIAHGSSSKN